MHKTTNPTKPAAARRRHADAGPHPRSIAVLAASAPIEEAEQPFEEGAHDSIDSDLRHRLISEAAFELYRQRGFVDGYDLEDWLAAETQVDHTLVQHESAEPETGE